MWHSGKEISDEEKEILRELEYDLFMFDPGFRSMWHDDFSAYFDSLFDERKWEERQTQRESERENDMGLRMIEDPDFARFMKEQAIMDEVLSGEMKIENAPFEMQAELREMMEMQNFDPAIDLAPVSDESMEDEDDPLEKDTLFVMARDWHMQLAETIGKLYDETRNIHAFRILNNCGLVASKIVFASGNPGDEDGTIDFEWRTDRIGYTLSLTSLNRCIDSLEKLENSQEVSDKIPTGDFLKTARQIRQGLMDRLADIDQQRLRTSSSKNKGSKQQN